MYRLARAYSARVGGEHMSEDRRFELHTERLVIREWRPEDREPFAALNADPEVMRYFMYPLPRDESDAIVDRIEAHFAEHGFCFWALEVPGRLAPCAAENPCSG